MKKFLLKTFLFFLLTVFGLSIILVNYGGYVDYFYEKFTVSKQTSMILGDSRSLQGIQPRIVDQHLNDSSFELPMFNYSFTIAQINYGKPYTESIIKKLQPSKKGLFIVSVHPWLFTEREGDDLENHVYSETTKPPYNMAFVNVNPNFEYLIRNFQYFHFETIIRKTVKLHKDGWLEESNLPKDTVDLNHWKNLQIKMYKDFSIRWEESPKRVEDFTEMIKFLQQNGRVVLVRMPVDSTILNIENRFWSNFDEEMNRLGDEHNITYFNFSKSDKFRTYDGNHLDKHGGIAFTKELCDSIKLRKK